MRAALAGCASIPTSGAVRPGRDVRVEQQDDSVSFIADGPFDGATPAQVVQGFLDAGADFRGDHRVAREYLTDRAAQAWRPSAVTLVHEGGTGPAVEDLGGGAVVARATEVARIDAEGTFARSAGATEVERTFRLVQEDGEWRIAELDNGLLLSQLDVDQAYRQVSLYFLSPTRNSLVPDTVLVPELAGLPTKVVSRLLRGPTAPLRGAVLTGFPTGTTLEVQSVPVSDGLATVPLSEEALGADQDAREQLSAQLVWTLKQLSPDIERIRITAGGDDLVVAGVKKEQDRDSWLTFDPDGLGDTASVYAVRSGVVGRIIEGAFQPVVGPAGSGDLLLRSPAVSLDTTELAAVSRDGRTLRVGQLTPNAGFDAVLTGGDLGAPSWDPLGNLWVVDRATGRLLLLPGGSGPAVEVTVTDLPGGRLPAAVAISRDGARAALVAGRGPGSRLVLGAVTGLEGLEPDASSSPRVVVKATHEVLPGVRAVRDVAWGDATTLTVLGSLEGAPVGPFTTSIDGYDVARIDSEVELATLTAAPASAESGPLVAETVDGQLVQYTAGGGWVLLGPGSDPAYPG
jgi:hypothetical protein